MERILASQRFESSPSLSSFLRYVVTEALAGRGAFLKEYSLGVMVFDRGDKFDPRLDPIVRVQARNLRARLAEYYAGSGADDPVLIDLPKRTYVPVFEARVVDAPEVPAARAPVAELVAPPAVEPRLFPAPPSAAIPAAMLRQRGWTVWASAILLVVLIAGAVWLVLPGEVQTAAHQPDSQALDLYIRARQLIDRQSETDLRAALDTLNEAIRHDPQFAAAYASIAEAYNVLAQFGYVPPGEGMQAARQAAQTALNLSPLLPDGHTAMAAILEAYDWNWKAAEREYRQAILLNPSIAASHLWYGMFLRDQGRIVEGLAELRRAAQLDPYSISTSVNLAYGLMLEGNFAAAAHEALHATQMAPSLVTAHVILANAYRAQSRDAEAEAALSRAAEAAGDDPHNLATLARALAWRGRQQDTQALYIRLETLAKSRYVSPYDLGTLSLALGEENRALAQLQEAFRQRSSGLIFLRYAKFAKNIRDPQFRWLIEKMGISG